eukprot:Em0014g505a
MADRVEGVPAAKKGRNLSIHTAHKWIAENEKELTTATWLTYERLDRDIVAALKCKICTMFESKLIGMRNFSRAFIDGCTNLKASAFKEHASSLMHQKSMVHYKKSQSVPVTEFAPIAKALSTIDELTEAVMARKFDIAYTICKEGFAFTKMSTLCELQEKHGVDLGSGYKNNIACTEFVHYIGMALREELVSKLGKAKFFSIQADGSTDAGRIEDELFVVLFFDSHSEDGVVHVRDKFLTVRRPELCTAEALKDAYKGTLWSTIDEMVLRVYYLYKKSPKKCRELEEVVSELKSCLEPHEFPKKGGNIPLHTSGTRWVSHKVVAVGRLLDRYGAYIAHLITLIEDPAVKSIDKEKLKGYVLQWRNAKMILGCALFHDILSSAATLCKALQNDELCIVSAVEAILRCTKAIEKVSTTTFENLPMVSKVLGRMKHDTGTSHTYQDVELSRYNEAANGRVERMFSTLKWIKTDRRSCLGEDTLDDLMRISLDGPPFANWNAKHAVELWWKGKAHRSVQDERAPPKPSSSAASTTTTQVEAYTLDINDWDCLLAD